MPKRLLFVDDEALMLEGLRRALHGPLRDWDMHFVDNAAAALSALGQQAYDAVVTDMRMPVMDGAQLLETVETVPPVCYSYCPFRAVERGSCLSLDCARSPVPIETV